MPCKISRNRDLSCGSLEFVWGSKRRICGVMWKRLALLGLSGGDLHDVLTFGSLIVDGMSGIDLPGRSADPGWLCVEFDRLSGQEYRERVVVVRRDATGTDIECPYRLAARYTNSMRCTNSTIRNYRTRLTVLRQHSVILSLGSLPFNAWQTSEQRSITAELLSWCFFVPVFASIGYSGNLSSMLYRVKELYCRLFHTKENVMDMKRLS
jgi:hypothetical protein